MAIYAESQRADASSVSPCGACRQLLYQFGKAATVTFPWQGEWLSATVAELLPYGFEFTKPGAPDANHA